MNYTIILVYQDGTTNKLENSEYTVGKWRELFLLHPDLEYIEYRVDGKKQKEFYRAGWYKHLAGDVK